MARPEHATSADHRQYVRHIVRGEAKIEALNDHCSAEPPLHVNLQDIGRTGVMFESDRALELNSTWRLRILHRGYEVTTLPIIVKYCREAPTGAVMVGAQFMIEPFVLSFLGVAEHELRMEDWLDPRVK